MAKYLYAEHTWSEIRAAAERQPVCVIPCGTTEQHGPHLPLAVDFVTASMIGDQAVQRVAPDALLLPTVCYGFNEHHMDFPGTIAIAGHDFINYTAAIGQSLARHGFRNILYLNGHGSNRPYLEIAAREVCNTSDAFAAVVSWWSLIPKEILAENLTSEFPGGVSHACELETSALLYLRPDLVDMSLAVREYGLTPSKHLWRDLRSPSPVVFNEQWSRFSRTGIQGDPTLASVEKGRAVVEAAVSELADLLVELREREHRARTDHH
ncbi:MAG TPA: creatininase family protein [Chloroflexota bacterium]|nr:creatininase family protein [Chloroflexota bacterium]